MITIELGKREYFNDATQEFYYEEGRLVNFEYSLKAIYDWEVKWRKPFLKGDNTHEELLDFYMTMALEPIDEIHLTNDVQQTLADYIQNPNTATTFSSPAKAGKKVNKSKIYTAEEIYALMFSGGIPLDFENRNLNRLLVILRIISSYNETPTKMSKQDIYKQNAALNKQRKAELKTRG